MTPVSQPSGLGELSASMFTEPDKKSEAIQRAQVGLLMGANGNNEPQNKTPRKPTPTSATARSFLPTAVCWFSCSFVSKACTGFGEQL